MTFRRNKSDPLQSPVDKHIDGVSKVSKITEEEYQRAVNKVNAVVMEQDLRSVKNVYEAVRTAMLYENDPELRDIASRILAKSSKTDNFFVLHPEEVAAYKQGSSVRELLGSAIGIHNTYTTGRKNIVIRSNKFATDLGLSLIHI